MLVLGIETSCDETGVALVSDGRLRGQKLATQEDLHALFGGVVPELASREHLRLLPRLFAALMAETGRDPADLDAVAVARGPGLLGALLVGVSFAKGLCLATGARLVGVDHLHAHLMAAGLERPLRFPALGLLVSGGHTHTYRLDSATEYELLGRTLDDAAGEALDKAAKRMNLPYPGGRQVDRLARAAMAGLDPDPHLFPRAFVDTDSPDFSFSGLKTAVSQYVDAHPGLVLESMDQEPETDSAGGRERARVCASLNLAVAETLRIKVARELDRMAERTAEEGGEPVRALVVAGGVAANTMIRETMAGLAAERGLDLVLPGPALCTDNAAMVAHAGWLLAQQGLGHGLDLAAVPRGRKVPRDMVAFAGKVPGSQAKPS